MKNAKTVGGILAIAALLISTIVLNSSNVVAVGNLSPSHQPQVQNNKISTGKFNIDISKVNFTLGTIPNQKYAEVYLSITNPAGKNVPLQLNGTIAAFIGASGKVYDIVTKDSSNHIDRSLDVTYANTEQMRKDVAQRQGKPFEQGVLLLAPGVMVDQSETNIADVVYQDESGNRTNIPVVGITPTITPLAQGK